MNGCHFAGNIFKPIFFNENYYILMQVSVQFVSYGPTDNMAALV